MKIKKTRVRLKDIHHGAVLYVAHPWYGIVKVVVKSKPKRYNSNHISATDSLFIDVLCESGFVDTRFLSDMGITRYYNSRRTFKKLKQAEAYVRWGLRDPDTIAQHNDHLEWIKDMDWIDDSIELQNEEEYFENYEPHFYQDYSDE